MARHVFRLATPADEPAIRRLQAELVAEMTDPLGIDESARSRTERPRPHGSPRWWPGRRTAGSPSSA